MIWCPVPYSIPYANIHGSRCQECALIPAVFIQARPARWQTLYHIAVALQLAPLLRACLHNCWESGSYKPPTQYTMPLNTHQGVRNLIVSSPWLLLQDDALRALQSS